MPDEIIFTGKNRQMNKTEIDFTGLGKCCICPHNCMVDRTSHPAGKCRTDSSLNIATIALHKGEEPLINGDKGICNIFFSGCNLKCIYCQNHQISNASSIERNSRLNVETLLDRIENYKALGARAVGFVSPSHVLPQVISIIEGMNKRGLNLVKVYNTNGYERPESIKQLEGLIDIYLPDFKYADQELAFNYSGARDYPEFAAKSIKEMYRQKGSVLFVSDDGQAESGLIIRHLVLPGSVENSLNVLRYIAEEISTNIHISLMSQYYPTSLVKEHPFLGRHIQESEYNKVVEEMYRLGFQNGWTQEFESSENYMPDFDKSEPFNEDLN